MEGAAVPPVSAVAGFPCLPSGGGRPADLLVPAESGTVVVAVFAAEKARLGDVFYDSVAARADPMVDQRIRETGCEENR
jgi:hypothetical protein